MITNTNDGSTKTEEKTQQNLGNLSIIYRGVFRSAVNILVFTTSVLGLLEPLVDTNTSDNKN